MLTLKRNKTKFKNSLAQILRFHSVADFLSKSRMKCSFCEFSSNSVVGIYKVKYSSAMNFCLKYAVIKMKSLYLLKYSSANNLGFICSFVSINSYKNEFS